MTIVIIDTETTGLGHANYPPREDAILQVGIAWRHGNEVKTWSEYCNPGKKFLANGRAKEALEINQIAPETISKAKPAKQIAKQLAQRLKEIEVMTGEKVELTAYNKAFDQAFLAKKPWQLAKLNWGDCVMKKTALKLVGRPRLKLQNAMQILKIPWPGKAHDAKTDAHAALLVHEKIR